MCASGAAARLHVRPDEMRPRVAQQSKTVRGVAGPVRAQVQRAVQDARLGEQWARDGFAAICRHYNQTCVSLRDAMYDEVMGSSRAFWCATWRRTASTRTTRATASATSATWWSTRCRRRSPPTAPLAARSAATRSPPPPAPRRRGCDRRRRCCTDRSGRRSSATRTTPRTRGDASSSSAGMTHGPELTTSVSSSRDSPQSPYCPTAALRPMSNAGGCASAS